MLKAFEKYGKELNFRTIKIQYGVLMLRRYHNYSFTQL